MAQVVDSFLVFTSYLVCVVLALMLAKRDETARRSL